MTRENSVRGEEMESKIFPTVRCAQDIVTVLAKYQTPVAMIDEVLATAKSIAEASTVVRPYETQDTGGQSK